LGLGININHLSYGITRSLDINLPYSYSLKVGNHNLSFGSAINFKSYQENYSKELVAIDDRTIDPSIPNTNLSSQSLNFGLGIYFSNNTSFLGLSTQSLVNDIVLVDNNVLIPSFRSLDIIGGLKFDVGSDVALLMQGMGRLATQFGSLLDLNAGFEYQNKMNFGIGMRLGTPIANAMTFNAGFDVVNGYIGFAYEYPLSQLRGVQLGSYEIIGFYSLKLKKSKYEGFNPRFF
ncbi:MAG TPA: PorP/SprF family type IX secretion system membrane protein, partial [Saprospiraceae bacterium]|nr:PorP/SprF family type IX secretion system membrane protein [Saprospiraceae bacterium]